MLIFVGHAKKTNKPFLVIILAVNILVTGGAGFIGSHLVDRLLDGGHQVTVIDDFSTGRKENLSPNKLLTVHNQDVCANLDKIFKIGKFAAVFHLAGLPLIQLSIEKPLATAKGAVNGALQLLESCLKFGVNKFIYTSSSAVYGNQKKLPTNEEAIAFPLSPYGIQKLTGEHYCWFFANVHSLETIIFRAFSVYGPRQIPNSSYGVVSRFIQAVENKKEIIINGDGTQTRDFIFVSDVVEALLMGISPKNNFRHGEIFNLGSGQKISINDLAAKVIGKKQIKVSHCPALVEQIDTQADTTKAKKLLCWEPKVTLDQGLEEAYKFLLTKQTISRKMTYEIKTRS